ncbi:MULTISPECIES: McrC family protein [unclassified Terrabacter]|uniref:McrC family protein n=1 Tax=unclassified Terrabacter TaxID=2630222 RepID=UPI0006FDCA58|nr:MULTISPECIES: restriction endonuclease [unclassified Terrabacter]KRB44084.1 restriction endonuclease [Terrabacter sp. Root181]KRF39487.1 restriction endonuclease [Terrabacter sp. Soil810]
MTIELAPIPEHGRSGPVRLSRETRAALVAAAGERLVIHATADPDVVTIGATSWVGALAVPGLVVRVMPKVSVTNFFAMLGAGVSPDAFDHEHVTWSDTDELIDGVAYFAIRLIDSATMRGLVHGYVPREERMRTIRGRLLVEEFARRPWSAAEPQCRFDDFTADIVENQLFRCTLQAMLSWPQLAPHIRREALRVLGRFDGVADTTATKHAAPLPITRLNEHYEDAMRLSRLVLQAMSLSHEAGDQQANSLMVDMDDLFQRWIAQELDLRLAPEMRIERDEDVWLDEGRAVTMAPDLVVRRGSEVVLVGDAKYSMGADGYMASRDYLELIAYTTAMGLPTGLLIHCNSDRAPESEIVIRNAGTRILCRPIRLDGSYAAVCRSLDSLADLVRELAEAPAEFEVPTLIRSRR